MSDISPSEYYRKREQQERALAKACVDRAIGAIHTELANRYADLVRKAESETQPRLKQRAPARTESRMSESASA